MREKWKAGREGGEAGVRKSTDSSRFIVLNNVPTAASATAEWNVTVH